MEYININKDLRGKTKDTLYLIVRGKEMKKFDKFLVWFWYGKKYIPYFEAREEYERYNVCRRRK